MKWCALVILSLANCAAQGEPESVCELLKHGDVSKGKIVELRGILVMADEFWSIRSSVKCKETDAELEEILIEFPATERDRNRVDLSNIDRSRVDRVMARITELRRSARSKKIVITAIGTFESLGGKCSATHGVVFSKGFGHLGSFCHRIIIQSLASPELAK